jgi:hypothetical protein
MSGEKCFFNGEIQEVSLGLVGNTDVNVAGVGGKPDAALPPTPLGLVSKPDANVAGVGGKPDAAAVPHSSWIS